MTTRADCIVAPMQIGRLGRALSALRQSPWAPVALRAAAVLVGMAVLSGLGAASMAKSLEGMSLGGQELNANLGAAWLAPTRPPPPPATPPAVGAGDGGDTRVEPECDAPAQRGITADGKVILNEADARELTRLPGVGPRRAEEIVALRTRLKRFRRLTDLLRVRGIGVRSLKRLKPHVVLDPPPEARDAGAGG